MSECSFDSPTFLATFCREAFPLVKRPEERQTERGKMGWGVRRLVLKKKKEREKSRRESNAGMQGARLADHQIFSLYISISIWGGGG